MEERVKEMNDTYKEKLGIISVAHDKEFAPVQEYVVKNQRPDGSWPYALQNPQLRGMGTTATVVKIINNQVYAGHVGDSRFYLLRAGFIYQITHDHSLVEEQLRVGLITEKEAVHHKLRNVITRSIGYNESELNFTSHYRNHHDKL